jgi:acyl carrier protein
MFNSALILLLLREGKVTTWGDLCHHFGCDPQTANSLAIALEHELRRLMAVGLVRTDPSIETRHLLPTDARLEVTNPVAALSSVLGLSLRSLASSRPEERMIVVPTLGPPDPDLKSSQVFVAMPFADALGPIYRDHIAPVVRDLGFSIARADDLYTARQVITDIWSAIANCSLVIADCTGRNPNVFYEIGLAHAIGKTVVLLTQDEADIPFDLRHLRYICYAYTPPGMRRFETDLRSVLRTHLVRGDRTHEERGSSVADAAPRQSVGLQEAIAASRRKRVNDTLRTIVDDQGATTQQRIAALVGLLLNRTLEDVSHDETIADQGADSIDMLELVAAIEEVFAVSLPESLAHSLILLNVRDLAAQLDSLHSSAGP